MKIILCFLSALIICHFLPKEIYAQDNSEEESIKVSVKKINDLSFGSINSGWKSSIKQQKEDSIKISEVNNPFCPSTNFKFILTESDPIDILLMDLNENIVSSLYKGFLSKGHYEMDLLNNYENSGVYFIVINIEEQKYYKKIILLK